MELCALPCEFIMMISVDNICMMTILRSSILVHFSSMMCPINLTCLQENSHFSALRVIQTPVLSPTPFSGARCVPLVWLHRPGHHPSYTLFQGDWPASGTSGAGRCLMAACESKIDQTVWSVMPTQGLGELARSRS